MATENLVPAKSAAELLGLASRTRSGKPSNHCSFLQRLEERFPDTFPKAKWIGARRYYEAVEIDAFKKTLPTTKPDRAA